MKKFFKSVLGFSSLCLFLSACSDIPPEEAFSLTPEGDHFVAFGVIDQTTPRKLRNALEARPDIKTIVMQYVPGSVDDMANLRASRLIRAQGIKTVVPSGGLVASGGTDMFLAGAEREIGTGACLGVHSWSGFENLQGSDLPRNDPQHQPYLDYYDAMGISREFYWYTLRVADSDSIHFMRNNEIIAYGMSTRALTHGVEVNPSRCEAIDRRYG